jgi:hypothetical protein
MPIKKSSLEQKWYFRVVKVFFLGLPFLAIAIMLLWMRGKALNILESNIIYAVIGLVAYFLVLTIIWRVFLYIAFGGLEDDKKKKGANVAQSSDSPNQKKANNMQLVAPAIILIAVFAIFMLSEAGYIKLPKINIDNNVINHTYGASCKDGNGKTGLYGTNGICYTCSGSTAVTSPTNNNCSKGTAGVYCCSGGNGYDGCISTGCGHMWYCSGSYYIGGQEINVPGLCFPVHPNTIYHGWTGTCRQCP